MDETSDSLLTPGTLLAHYEVLRPIGEGAMGRVYEAKDTSLDRTVAIKVLRSEIAGDESVVARFDREARAAARVNHPNLAHVYFVAPEKECHYFAMEFVPGLTLAEHVAEHGPMELPEALDVLIQAAEGLAAAHEAGVIHRDVKPSNLKLPPSGIVKITDFGLSKRLTGETDMTGEGRILGTPRYMSPEQCRGEKMDRRTDIYSLGLVGWFLLTGKPPFDADSIGKLLDDQMNRPLPPLREEKPDLPPAVQRVLEAMCAKKREERPENMEEVIKLLGAARPRPMDLAPIAIRASAVLVDVFLAFVLLATTDGILVRLFGAEEYELNLHWLAAFITAGIFACVQIGLEVLAGTTPAKYAFNLRVVRPDGGRPRADRIVARFLLRFPMTIGIFILLPAPGVKRATDLLQFLVIVAGVVCFFAFRRRTLSDLVTGTRVVYQGSRMMLPFRR